MMILEHERASQTRDLFTQNKLEPWLKFYEADDWKLI